MRIGIVSSRVVPEPGCQEEHMPYPAGEIPGLLRQDGSPPAFYLLLHAWTDLAGTSEVA